MRAVVQRVRRASVTVDGAPVSSIDLGFLILLGVQLTDDESDADYLADKIAGLRIFPDADDKMNLSLSDVAGAARVVSQFTLLADCRKGRRPSFTDAAPPERANDLYLYFCRRLADAGVPVQRGTFQTVMDVELINHGPVTVLLDSRKNF